MHRASGLVTVTLATLLLLAGGCGDDDTTRPNPPGTIAPDFALVDVNTASALHDSTVSPRDYLMSVSAYYFGHAT
jgi:hypothetical protein